AIVVVLMHGADIAQHPAAFATWSGAAEQLALLAGGVAAYACLAVAAGRSGTMSRLAVFAMGICLLIFGLAHFLYLDFTASRVPAGSRGGKRFWAAFTGAAHRGGGAAPRAGVRAGLAAILVTVMFAGFVLLVHLPLLLAQPNHLNWVMNAVNLSLTG